MVRARRAVLSIRVDYFLRVHPPVDCAGECGCRGGVPRRGEGGEGKNMNVEQIGKQVLDAAFHVHTVLGPGLLESVYEAALTLELRKRGLRVEVQRAIP